LNNTKSYIIPFKGLTEGNHPFSFIVDNEFFEKYDFSDVKGGNIIIDVLLSKKAQLLELKFSINGEINIMCDRCLEYFLLPFKYKTILYIKFGNIFEEIEENIITIPYSEKEINILQYIYEFIHLNLPYRRIHPNYLNGKSLCNKQMLEKINQYIKNKNED